MSVVRTLIGNVKGPQGATGATGATGAQGEAATIEVGTVTTGAYGTNASVTNSGTEQEAVFDFVIPQGAPGEEVTDASNLTLNEITASSASYPTFTVQEQLKGIFGKIQKFLSDLKSNYVSKSMMTESTNVSTAGEYVADAKAINSLNTSLANTDSNVSALNTSLSNCATKTELAQSTFQHISTPSDLNSMLTLWEYTDFTFAKTPSNAPYGAGTVYTLGGMAQVQVMFPYSFDQNKFVYFRTRYSNTWGSWYKVAIVAV